MPMGMKIFGKKRFIALLICLLLIWALLVPYFMPMARASAETNQLYNIKMERLAYANTLAGDLTDWIIDEGRNRIYAIAKGWSTDSQGGFLIIFRMDDLTQESVIPLSSLPTD